MNVGNKFTKQQIVDEIASQVGYDANFGEESTFALTLNPHLWFPKADNTQVNYDRLCKYLEVVSKYYIEKEKKGSPILILDGLNSFAKKGDRDVLHQLGHLSEHLAETRLMSIIMGATEGNVSDNFLELNNRKKKDIWVDQCGTEEMKEFLDKIQKQIREKAKCNEPEKEGERFRKMAEELNDTMIGNNIGHMSLFIQNYKNNPDTAKEEFTKEFLTHAEETLRDSEFTWSDDPTKVEERRAGFNLLMENEIFPELLKDGAISKDRYYHILRKYSFLGYYFTRDEVLVCKNDKFFFQGGNMKAYVRTRIQRGKSGESNKDTQKE